MPLSKLHRQVVTVSLRAAARHGFTLGGGNALIAYGIIARPTQDVDLVTNQDMHVSLQVNSPARRRRHDQAQRGTRRG